MQSNQSGGDGNQDLVRQIEGATAEKLHALLLKAGQRFLQLAIDSMEKSDLSGKSRNLSRVSEIIMELTRRLNHEDTGELVKNLSRIYSWWIDEIFDAGQKNQPDRMHTIVIQMGEMQSTWEELDLISGSTSSNESGK